MKNNVNDLSKKINRLLPYILIIVVCFVVVALSEMALPTFTFKIFISPTFWIKTILLNIACVLVQWSTALASAQEIEMRDEDGSIGIRKEVLKSLVADVKDDAVVFLKEVNRERKTEAYKRNIMKKINKLIAHASYNNNFEFSYYLELNDKEKEGYKIPPDCTKYFDKRIKLMQKLDEDYIKKNIDYLKVKYKQVTLKMMKFGISRNEGNTDDVIPISKEKILSELTLPSRIKAMALAIFLSTFALESVTLSIAFAFGLVSKMVSLLYSSISGKKIANQVVQESTISNMDISIDWIKKYKRWQETREKKEGTV